MMIPAVEQWSASGVVSECCKNLLIVAGCLKHVQALPAGKSVLGVLALSLTKSIHLVLCRCLCLVF